MAGWERHAASRCQPAWCSCCGGRRWRSWAGSCGLSLDNITLGTLPWLALPWETLL